MKLAIGSVYDVVIFDTAGRLHVDEEMMHEVEKVREIVKPDEVLMVLDSMIGQDAVQTAKSFNDRLAVTGFVLTKMDGDARGGVALSIRSITGKPIKFIGVSEKIEGLEPFFPDRLSSRILGLGDVLSLIEKVEQTIDEKKAKELEKKLKKAEFTFNDFLDQIRQIQKMGSLRSILEMLPGANKMKGLTIDEKQMKHVEAIICSMTGKERSNPKLINYSRKKRIASGSGRPLSEVTKLLDNFENMKKMVKKVGKMGPKGLSRIPFNF